MPSFKLDGQEIPFEPGDTIMRAAWRQGIEIPHYCWHPGLSVAANCRMCLVEIKAERPMLMPIMAWDASKKEFVPATKPKLQPACQQMAVEGQEVFAKSGEATKAQGNVQEFLLLNHPVDCPICDQAGECKLQDYWETSQGKLKRKMTEPVHKPKGVTFGPTIVYDAERCIMCTRCIRVNDEVVGDHVLDMRERGNKNEIVLSPGRELDHDYTLMSEHVCPVGALTSKDFRFKARVWFLRAAPSVCQGCATGCNDFVDFDPRKNTVYRLRPRDNEAVNKFWMCDDGMMSYTRVHQDRVTQGVIRNGESKSITAAEAVATAAKYLAKADGKKVGVVLSAQHSTEDNLAAAKLAKDVFGTDKLYLTARGGWKADKILRHADNNPNRAGAERAAGGPLKPVSDLLKDIASGTVEAVVALGWASAEDAEALAPLRKLVATVSLSSNIGALTEVASVVIPVASFAELDGTFVNAKGMAQKASRAINPPAGIKGAAETISDLAKALGKSVAVAPADVQRVLATQEASA